MSNIKTYVGATEARNNFFDLLEQVKKIPYPVNITINGIPEAVIMSKEEYDGWMATFETLADGELMRSIKQSRADFKNGRYESWEKIKKESWLKNVLNLSKQTVKKRSKKTR